MESTQTVVKLSINGAQDIELQLKQLDESQYKDSTNLELGFYDSMSWGNITRSSIKSAAEALKKMKNLRGFSLSFYHVTVCEGACSEFGEAIKGLSLENIQFSICSGTYANGVDLGDFWEPLKNSQGVKSTSIYFQLDMGSIDHSKTSAGIIKALNAIQTFEYLENFQIFLGSDAVVEVLENLGNSIAKLKNLKTLKVSGDWKQEEKIIEIVKPLPQLSKLENLELRFNEANKIISLPTLESLSKCENLRSLYLALPFPDGTVIDPMVTMIRKNDKLESASINCSYHSWTIEEYRRLVDEGFMKTKNLKSLDIDLTEGALIFNPEVYDSADKMKSVIPSVSISNRDIN